MMAGQSRGSAVHSLTFETADLQLEVDKYGLERGFKPGAVILGPKVVAYVNHGRWVADCLTPYCGGARVINPDHNPFWCVYCGQSYLVEWPAELQAIATILEQRPLAQNQNFHPLDHVRLHPTTSPNHVPCPDALVFLAYENDVRGIPVGNDILKRRYESWLSADWAKRGLAREMAGFNVGGD